VAELRRREGTWPPLDVRLFRSPGQLVHQPPAVQPSGYQGYRSATSLTSKFSSRRDRWLHGDGDRGGRDRSLAAESPHLVKRANRAAAWPVPTAAGRRFLLYPCQSSQPPVWPGLPVWLDLTESSECEASHVVWREFRTGTSLNMYQRLGSPERSVRVWPFYRLVIEVHVIPPLPDQWFASAQ
jgi:hypothetical protein